MAKRQIDKKIMGGGRESNIELLRNILMFMILLLHANFVALGEPTAEDLTFFPISTVLRWLVEGLSIASVNAFVMISGWFGIKSSLEGVLKFIYQILFFLGISFVVALCLGILESPIHAVLDVFQLTRYDWFIKSYFVLMILAPLLNQFKTLEVSTQRNMLLLFFGFEAVYGWVAGGSRFFVSGYGPLHLIGIYLLGEYLHYSLDREDNDTRFKAFLNKIFGFNSVTNFLLFLLFSIAITVMGLLDLKVSGGKWSNILLAYCNPLVVIASVYLFLSFARLKIKSSRFINWLGASSFAVYLLHGDFIVRHKVFIPFIQRIDGNTTGVQEVLLISAFLIMIYFVACLIDQIRKYSWNLISKEV
jgi:peptidoglycan/LPS O-acetylase OafA/YrhL